MMTELFEALKNLLPDYLKHSKANAKQLKALMIQLDNLNANIKAQTSALVDNTAAVTAATAAIGAGAVNPADIQAAADGVAANTVGIAANTAALNAALNPPAPPAPPAP